MNLRYAKRSEDTEQINVASWAAWNERQYPELKWLHHIPNGGSSRTLRRNLLHIRGCGGGAARVLRVIVSAVDERTEQQCLERRHNLATEEKVRTGAWMNMQQ